MTRFKPVTSSTAKCLRIKAWTLGLEMFSDAWHMCWDPSSPVLEIATRPAAVKPADSIRMNMECDFRKIQVSNIYLLPAHSVILYYSIPSVSMRLSLLS
jgi:hypothetical protein